ncbi:unnamed protein product, partial [Prorocentrum cordatum]
VAFGSHFPNSPVLEELDYLKGAVDSPVKPMAAIVGGAKVSTKIPVIESMLEKVDKVIIGGGMVFTFLKARGLSVGNSLVEDDLIPVVKKLEEQAKAKGVEIILPSDIACGDEFPAGGKEVNYKVVPADDIPDGWLGLDNGPKATEEIKAALADCKTIIWNGPMGVFESPQFSKGTYDVAECIAELTEKNGAISIIGGGDSVSAVNKSGLAPKMSHISTGGGASLELLEGKVLPGVAALDEKEMAAAAFCGQRKVTKASRTSLQAKKSVEDLGEADLKGKTVLIRCDLNVPLNADLEITDDTRITASIPTIEYLCSKGAKVLACSHLGRPKDGPEEKFSLKPVAKKMGELMKKDIKCAPDCKATDEVKGMVSAMSEGDVLILENTRFYKGETKNDPELAESMASLADLFVNDAFGTAHRAHSSTEGVTKFLKPSVSGFLLKKELDYLKGAVDSPVKPMAAIVGGAKVSTKIPVIESMLEKVDKVIIGGGMVFTFLKARGLSVGNSLVEDDLIPVVKKLEEQAKAKGVEIILPSDIACGDEFPAGGKEVNYKVVPADDIPDGWLGLDNGPKATEEIKAALADCKTIIWNGPMGVFESPQFSKGTYDVAECIAELTEKNGAISIIGGGDSVSAVNKSGLAPKMSHISTGGGASLELLEGKVLPGVAALDEKEMAAAAFCGQRKVTKASRTSLQAKKSVEDLGEADLKGKTVLIRCDLNVPLNADLEITDDTRITASIPTIEYLCSKGAKVLACSHLGRPKDGPEEKFSLKPVAKKMGELMKKDIKCAPDCKATDEVKGMVSAMSEGDVLILENTRFYKGETKNDPELAESMASLADLFVNDAFGTAHRAHSSTEGVTKFLKPSVSGFLLKKELDYLKGAVDSPVKPMAAIVGGAKVSTKIPVIESMLEKVDKVIIGGGMVFTFLKARGLSVGNSLVEDDLIPVVKKLEEQAKAKGVEIILPSDIACGDEFPAGGKEVNYKVVPADDIPDGWLGLDNGPKATEEIKAALADCKTIIWNGPMGVFESPQFSKGTYDVAECIAELTEKNGAISIIGGGDSVSAVNKSGLAPKMSHISTGGGASLELLEGKVLPGVAALDEKPAGQEVRGGPGRGGPQGEDGADPVRPQRAPVLACSHLGRPKDGPEEKFSLKPVAKKMGELMKKDIKCAPDCKATDEVKGMVSAMSEGDVLILENTRFYKGETKNDPELAESMASLADLFVNDAFGTAHRAHSSTEGVTKFLKPSVSGFLLKKELDYLKGAVDNPVKPMAAIVGGAKVSTKIPVIESMLEKVDKVIIGGGMVFTFLKARGLSVGNSLVEDDLIPVVKKLEEEAKAKGVEIILPSDIACGDEFPAGGKEVNYKVVPADAIPDGWLGLDNGPKATEEIKAALADCKTIIWNGPMGVFAALADCKTIIWNGPMGVFESPQFSKGTYDVAECIAELTEKNGAISIIGGGDSVSAVNKSGLAPKMSHISTGGGASLELLEGKVLPGVAALDEKEMAAAAFCGQRKVPKASRTSLQAKKSVEDLGEADLKGKTVLIRCDLNVPLNADLEITDDTRITASIPTIEYLCSKGAKVLACSHLGRPKDGPEEKFSLKPVAKKMGELMKKDIKCAPDCKATDEVKGMVSAMSEGDVLILENTRFYKGETKNDPELAESMASLADLFVNDAFGTAHRAHSSTEGVTKFLKPSVSGFLLKKELDYLKGAVDSPVKPMAAIVGGAKVSTKIPVIESMLEKVDKVIIGGGMVFTFLKARGLSVGNSLVEDDLIPVVKKLEEQAKAKGVEIILPSDIACGDEFPAGGKEVNVKVVPADAIPDGWLGLDNGPKATEQIKAALADCKTIIWNGPMGVFESPQFSKGTYDVAECIAELTEKNGAISIIGGGDSVSAVNKSGLAPKMSHISTGGGASLELLEGKVLPGVAALDEKVEVKKSVADLGEADLKGKTVLIRCDLNVPLNADLEITDDTRITASIPTIEYLCSKGARVLACSHLGRPKDGPEEKFSLKPVAKKMGELMTKDIKCAPDCKATDEVKGMVSAMSDGDVLILENTRFYKGETKNDPELAESMASLADLFVNDAFGTAHRAHSSTEGVTKFLKPSVSGFLLKKELDYLKGAVDNPVKPMAAIVGGAKVSTKIPVIESMLEKVDKVIIGGGMVFTFLKARGLSVGNSLVEDDLIPVVKKLEEQAKARGVEIILPSDIACGDEFPAGGKEVNYKVVPADAIPDGWLGLDNGPKATEEIKAALADCKTIIWNGPMGVFESPQFSKGTYDVAECIAELTEKNGAISIIGGGDSVSAVNKSGLAPKMSHISTGGGASLELLEGKVLPG